MKGIKIMRAVIKYVNNYVFLDSIYVDIYAYNRKYLSIKEDDVYDPLLDKMYYKMKDHDIKVYDFWLDNAIEKIDDPRLSVHEQEYLVIASEKSDYYFGPIFNFFDMDTCKELGTLMSEEIHKQIENKKDPIIIDLEYAIELMNDYHETDEFTIKDFDFFEKSAL